MEYGKGILLGFTLDSSSMMAGRDQFLGMFFFLFRFLFWDVLAILTVLCQSDAATLVAMLRV